MLNGNSIGKDFSALINSTYGTQGRDTKEGPYRTQYVLCHPKGPENTVDCVKLCNPFSKTHGTLCHAERYCTYYMQVTLLEGALYDMGGPITGTYLLMQVSSSITRHCK